MPKNIKKRNIIKSYLLYLICIFLSISTLFGCSKNQSNTIEKATLNPFSNLRVENVKWVTKIGGLPSNKNWAVLYPQKDFDKIKRITDLVNASTSLRKATKEDIEFLNTKHGYPSDIVFHMIDGREYALKLAQKLSAKKVENGTEITGTTLRDRILIAENKNGDIQHYTVFSESVANYMLEGSEADFPRVNGLLVVPENIELGNQVALSGDGYTTDEVDIIINNGNDGDLEEYIIGKVRPTYGSWKWDGVIDDSLKTYDGKQIDFKHEGFYLGISFDGNKRISGQRLNLGQK